MVRVRRSVRLCTHLYLILPYYFPSRRPRGVKPVGMDGQRDGEEEEEAILKVSNVRVGKRVPLQCLRLKTEKMGTCPQPQPY